MAAPLFSPARGVGSQVSSGGTVYQFGQGGWSPVASGGGTKPGPTPPPKPQARPQAQQTQQPQQGEYTNVLVGGMTKPDISPDLSAIESAYNEQMNYLSNIEGRLRPEYEGALAEAQKAFEAQQATLGGQRTQAQRTLEEQRTKGQQSYETALAEARRLYDQLQRGYQQRFGGATSAGQAATEIASQERLRQQGQNYRALQDVNRQVASGLQNIEQQYNQNLLALEQNRIASINQAKRDFTDRLNQIDQLRAQAGTNKAQAKLQALQNLRSQILAIESNSRTFEQNLALMREQARLQLSKSSSDTSNLLSNVLQGTQAATGTMGAGNLNTLVSRAPATMQPQATQQAYTGRIQRKPEDILALNYTPMQGSAVQTFA